MFGNMLTSTLVAGDSGSFVILDGKVCGTIIAGRDSLNLAYMIPITDTFQSIAAEYGGVSVNFPGVGTHQQLRTTSSQPVQSTPSGKLASAKPMALPIKATKPIDEISSIPPINSPSGPTVPAGQAGTARLPLTPEKLDSSKSEDTKNDSRAIVPRQPKREGNLDPQKDSSEYLPPSYALVNSPPSTSDIRLGSVVPDIRNPAVDAQGGCLLAEWGDQVRSIKDFDFRMTTRSTSHDSKFSWFSRPSPQESHYLALRAGRREKHELVQPVDGFWELIGHAEIRRDILRLRERYGKKLYFIIGLVSLHDANWTIGKERSKVTRAYAVSAAPAGIPAEVDHRVESEVADEQLAFVSRGDRVFAVGYREIRFSLFGQGDPKLDTRTRWQLLAGDIGRKGFELSF